MLIHLAPPAPDPQLAQVNPLPVTLVCRHCVAVVDSVDVTVPDVLA